MQKKLFFLFAIIISIIFSFSVCFAADMVTDATNAVKDTVTNAGNAIENTGNTMRTDMNNATSRVTGTNDDTYTATRTATNGNATFMGMNATAWTWLILGIAAIAIIAVVWYYSMQITSENNHSRRD